MDEQFALAEASEYPSNGGPPQLAEYGPISLTIRADLDFEEFTALWTTLTGMHRSHLFWIGDVQVGAFAKFGEDAAQLLDGYSAESFRQARWVCERFPPSERRVELTFSHHRIAAGLDRREDRMRMLEEAVAEKLSTRDFEALVKALKNPPPPAAAKAEGDDPGDEHRAPSTASTTTTSSQPDPRAIRAPFERLRENFIARVGPDGGRLHDHDDALVWEAVLAAVDYVLVGRASAETGLRFALEQLRLRAVE